MCMVDTLLGNVYWVFIFVTWYKWILGFLELLWSPEGSMTQQLVASSSFTAKTKNDEICFLSHPHPLREAWRLIWSPVANGLIRHARTLGTEVPTEVQKNRIGVLEDRWTWDSWGMGHSERVGRYGSSEPRLPSPTLCLFLFYFVMSIIIDWKTCFFF